MTMDNLNSLTIIFLALGTVQFRNVQSIPSSNSQLTDLLEQFKDASGNLLTNTSAILQDPLTQTLCPLKTDELIAHYGYIPEEHKVTTKDGYILTIFRCNYKKQSTNNTDVVIIHHGILSSSDDFTINMPSQALAYVMAKAGFDVWLTNARGNYYSRHHITKNPDDPASGFWDFSWDDIGFNDYTAVFDYIRQSTSISKFYVIAHSQGTSSMMALLSEMPEYNKYIKALSLMAPVGYLYHSSTLYRLLGTNEEFLEGLTDKEFLPRSILNNLLGTVCGIGLGGLCEDLLNLLYGQSDDRNNTMLSTYFCHFPSGSSASEYLHFFKEIKYGYFGRRMIGSEVPPDFPLWKITAPISLHYSTVDPLADPTDVKRLIRELNGTQDLYIQEINNTEFKFDHIDFMWGIHAAEVVYSEILKFFAKHQ